MQINRYSFPLSVHYIPEGIVHYMTECRQVTRRRRHKKKEKTFKKLYTISRNPCTVYPGIRCTVYPGINVHYVPEYSETEVSFLCLLLLHKIFIRESH